MVRNVSNLGQKTRLTRRGSCHEWFRVRKHADRKVIAVDFPSVTGNGSDLSPILLTRKGIGVETYHVAITMPPRGSRRLVALI